MESFTVQTSRQIQVMDVTDRVVEIVDQSGVREGFCIVHVPHATAALIVNEWEPNIASDYVKFFSEVVPKGDWAHNAIDDNAEAHMKSAFFGSSKSFIISKGELVLGTWQRIILCEFDGPRARKVNVACK